MRVKLKQIQRRIDAIQRFRNEGKWFDTQAHFISADDDRKHLVGVVTETRRKVDRAIALLETGDTESVFKALEELRSELDGS